MCVACGPGDRSRVSVSIQGAPEGRYSEARVELFSAHERPGAFSRFDDFDFSSVVSSVVGVRCWTVAVRHTITRRTSRTVRVSVRAAHGHGPRPRGRLEHSPGVVTSHYTHPRTWDHAACIARGPWCRIRPRPAHLRRSHTHTPLAHVKP